jgi:hypothetical protein
MSNPKSAPGQFSKPGTLKRGDQRLRNHSGFPQNALTKLKIVSADTCDEQRENKGDHTHAYEQGSHPGKRAPISRDSFFVPSNRGLPPRSKKLSPESSQGMGASRADGTRILLYGRRIGLRSTTASRRKCRGAVGNDGCGVKAPPEARGQIDAAGLDEGMVIQTTRLKK